jgi:hypothetical protein
MFAVALRLFRSNRTPCRSRCAAPPEAGHARVCHGENRAVAHRSRSNGVPDGLSVIGAALSDAHVLGVRPNRSALTPKTLPPTANSVSDDPTSADPGRTRPEDRPLRRRAREQPDEPGPRGTEAAVGSVHRRGEDLHQHLVGARNGRATSRTRTSGLAVYQVFTTAHSPFCRPSPRPSDFGPAVEHPPATRTCPGRPVAGNRPPAPRGAPGATSRRPPTR